MCTFFHSCESVYSNKQTNTNLAQILLQHLLHLFRLTTSLFFLFLQQSEQFSRNLEWDQEIRFHHYPPKVPTAFTMYSGF